MDMSVVYMALIADLWETQVNTHTSNESKQDFCIVLYNVCSTHL